MVLTTGVRQRQLQRNFFQPSDVEGLLMWIDASDTSTVSVNGSDQVTSISDKSSSGNDLTAETGREPSYVTDAEIGQGIISFDSADNGAMTFDTDINMVGKTLFYASRRGTTDITQTLFSHPSHTTTLRYFSDPVIMLMGGAPSLGNPNVGGPSGFADVMNDMSVFCAKITNTNAQLFMNDEEGGQKSHSTSTYNFGQIGRYRDFGASGNNPLNGDIAEFLIYDRDDLADQDILKIKNYLIKKWMSLTVQVKADGSLDYTDITTAMGDYIYRPISGLATVELSSETYSEVSIPQSKNIHLKGQGTGNTIIDGSQANTASSSDISDNSPIDFDRPGIMEGITVQGSNIRYAVHMEPAGNNLSDYDLYVIENCTIQHRGNPSGNNTWSNQWAVGAGSADGSVHIIRNSTLSSENYGAFSIHDNVGFTRPNRVMIDQCTLSTNSGNKLQPMIKASSLGSGLYNMPFIINNVTDASAVLMDLENGFGITSASELYDTQNAWQIDVYNSSLLILPNDLSSSRRFRSEVLTFEDATADRADIIISGDAASLIMNAGIGDAETLPGGGGLAAKIYGRYNVSEHNVGLSLDTNNHSLGQRLGDCSSVSKTLIIGFDGGNDTVTIIFDQNYTDQTNADILYTINTALGSKGTAHFINRDNEVFRKVTVHADETEIYNNSTIGFEVGEAIVLENNIYRKATSDDISIAGIVLERIVPGASGRLKVKGYIHQDHIAFIGADVTENDMVGIDPAVDGQLKVISSGNAIATGWASEAIVFNVS